MAEISENASLFEVVASNITNVLNIIDGEDDTVVEAVDLQSCLFHDTLGIYTDCCTDSSIKVCNILSIMFFAALAGYIALFVYIMNKNPWIKQHGLYINVFCFQMLVLLFRGLYYSYFGRVSNKSLNTYMAFRTAPLIASIQSMTSYSIHLILMNYRYSGVRRSVEETKLYQGRMIMTYWGIFIVYLGVWFFIWRMCVSHEAIVSMDWVLTTIYFLYMLFQIYLVRQLYSKVKNSMKAVAQQANCQLFMVKLIIMLHIGLRIVMNSLSDSGARVQGNLTQQVSWVYILLGDAITEMFSAFGMILLMTITFTFEAMAKQYQHQEITNENMNPDTQGEQLLVTPVSTAATGQVNEMQDMSRSQAQSQRQPQAQQETNPHQQYEQFWLDLEKQYSQQQLMQMYKAEYPQWLNYKTSINRR